MDKKERQEFDAQLERVSRTVDPARPPRPRVPSWWKGEEAATASNLEAARQMGYTVVLGN